MNPKRLVLLGLVAALVMFVGVAKMASSLDANRELGMFVSNPAAIERIRSTFEQDWNARS